jgi:hypothetical protein
VKKLLLIFGIFSLLGISSCEEESNCDCSSTLSEGNSINCYGTTQQGDGCDNVTLNQCGYCYLHTSQCN